MGTIQIDGSTPKLTIGNATAEDATILFDGNAQDFYIALDDSADDLLIGLGSTVGTTPIISMDENKKVSLAADLDVTTVATAATFEPDGDTAAGDNAAIGYTASEGLILTGQGSTDDVTIKNDADATVLQVATGTVNVELTAGNLIIGTSGKGIDFSATADSSGSMASELLDDYEEGTWTPTFTSDGNTLSFTGGTETYTYTKIGNTCHLKFNIQNCTTSGTAATGDNRITIPFNGAANLRQVTTVINYHTSGGLRYTGGDFIMGEIGSSSSFIQLLEWTNSSGYRNISSEPSTGSGTYFWFTITYQTA